MNLQLLLEKTASKSERGVKKEYFYLKYFLYFLFHKFTYLLPPEGKYTQENQYSLSLYIFSVLINFSFLSDITEYNKNFYFVIKF